MKFAMVMELQSMTPLTTRLAIFLTQERGRLSGKLCEIWRRGGRANLLCAKKEREIYQNLRQSPTTGSLKVEQAVNTLRTAQTVLQTASTERTIVPLRFVLVLVIVERPKQYSMYTTSEKAGVMRAQLWRSFRSRERNFTHKTNNLFFALAQFL